MDVFLQQLWLSIWNDRVMWMYIDSMSSVYSEFGFYWITEGRGRIRFLTITLTPMLLFLHSGDLFLRPVYIHRSKSIQRGVIWSEIFFVIWYYYFRDKMWISLLNLLWRWDTKDFVIVIIFITRYLLWILTIAFVYKTPW